MFMNYLYTAAEENRLATAAETEARRLRALAAAGFWSAIVNWACSVAGRPAHRTQVEAAARPQAK
jgi:hypothetical protein